MSQKSKTSPDIPPGAYSRNSVAFSGAKSQSGSGEVNVVMHVGNHWSPHSAPGTLLYDRPSTDFWRKTIAIVMIPFVFTGAPVLSSIISLNSDQINSTSKWLKYIFSKPRILPLNVLAIIITSVLNLWLIYLFSDLFIKLFILGEIPNYFIDSLYDSIELIPILLAVDLFWVKGYLLRDVIFKLDTISLNSEQPNQMAIIVKLIVIYLMCFSLHIINYLTYQWRLSFGYTGQTPSDYFKHLPFRIVNTFLIPVYITFLCVSYSLLNKIHNYFDEYKTILNTYKTQN